MSESDDTLDIVDDERDDLSEDCTSPSILTGFVPAKSTSLAKTSFVAESNEAKRSPSRKHPNSLDDITASPQYLPTFPKLQKIDKILDDGTLFVPSSCSPPSTQDESFQSSQETEGEKDEIFCVSERVREVEMQADILAKLKEKGVPVKASKEFANLKEKLIQVRVLLSSLTLTQDIDILNASKQDVGSLSSKQKRLVDLFKRCKDAVSRIQSLKRDDKVIIEDSDFNKIPCILPGVYTTRQSFGSKADDTHKTFARKEENDDTSGIQDEDQENVVSRFCDLDTRLKRGEINSREQEESFNTNTEQAQLPLTEHNRKDLNSRILPNTYFTTSTVSTHCAAASTIIGMQGNATEANGTSSTLGSRMQEVTIGTTITQTTSTPSLCKYSVAANTQVYVITGNIPTLATTHSTEDRQRCTVVKAISLPVSLSTFAISCANTSSTTNSRIRTIVRPISLPASNLQTNSMSSQQELAVIHADKMNVNKGMMLPQPVLNTSTHLLASNVARAASLQPTHTARSSSQISFVAQTDVAARSPATLSTMTSPCASTLVSTGPLPTSSFLNAQVYSTTYSTQSMTSAILSSQNVTGGVAVRPTANTRSSQHYNSSRTAPYTTNLQTNAIIATATASTTGSSHTSTKAVSLPPTVSYTSSFVTTKPVAISCINGQPPGIRSHDLPKTVLPASRPVEITIQKSTAPSDKSNDYSKSSQRRAIIPSKRQDFTGRPEVDIVTLLRHKVISPGYGVLSVISQGRKFEASLKPNGNIESTGGEIFHTPMAWLKAVTGSKTATRQPVAYSKIFYKDKPLAAFTIPSNSTLDKADGIRQETPNGSCEALEVQQMGNDSISSLDLSKLLHANCKIHLISDLELIPTASILPHDFWKRNFDDIDIDPKLLDF